MKTHKPTNTTRLAAFAGICAMFISAGSTLAGDAFIEWTTITPSAVGQLTSGGAVGKVAGSDVTLNVLVARNYVFAGIAGLWLGNTDNSQSNFNAPQFTPRRGNLDEIAVVGNSDFEIVFSPPVTDPVLHIHGLDMNQWTMTTTTTTGTVAPAKVSGNLVLVGGTVILGGAIGVTTNHGSFKFDGAVSSIRWSSNIANAGDGVRFQVSVPVNVDCCCTPPDANNDTFNYGLEHPSFPLQLNVLGNDTDPNALPMTIVNVYPPELATISPSGTSLQFTPDANFNGTASVWYEVSNGDCTSWAVATVHFANNPPVAMNDFATTFDYTGNTYITVDARINDIDNSTDKPNLKIISFVPPVTGKVEIVANKLQFRCNNSFTGQENFAYTISDGFGGTSSARVFITARRKLVFTGQLENTSSERIQIDIQTTPTGKYTGSVCIGDNCFTLQGVFAEGRPTTQTIKRKGQADLVVELEMVDGQLETTVTDGAKVASGPIGQANTLSTPAYYTFLIDQPGAAAPTIKGNGYGGLTVKANGTFIVKGALPDGKAFASSGTLTSANIAMFYKPLGYTQPTTPGATGSIFGAMTLPQSGTAISGSVWWQKPQQNSGGSPLAALSVVMNTHGEEYTVPASGQIPLILPAGAGVAEFTVAPTYTPNSVNVTFLANGSILQTSGKPPITLTTKFFPTTGFFKGSGYSTSFGATVQVQHCNTAGALLQGSQNLGGGYVIQKPFLGTGLIEFLP